MNNYETLRLILVAIECLGVIGSFVLGFRLGRDFMNSVLISCALATAISFLIGCTMFYTAFKEEKYVSSKYEEAVNNGFTIFYDGQQVKADDIELSYYKVSFDEEKKKIFLTRK